MNVSAAVLRTKPDQAVCAPQAPVRTISPPQLSHQCPEPSQAPGRVRAAGSGSRLQPQEMPNASPPKLLYKVMQHKVLRVAIHGSSQLKYISSCV